MDLVMAVLRCFFSPGIIMTCKHKRKNYYWAADRVMPDSAERLVGDGTAFIADVTQEERSMLRHASRGTDDSDFDPSTWGPVAVDIAIYLTTSSRCSWR
jgi:hypothetical protein